MHCDVRGRKAEHTAVLIGVHMHLQLQWSSGQGYNISAELSVSFVMYKLGI